MLTTTVNLPTRRTPSPQIRARDPSLDGTTNGTAGVNSAPDVDAGVNSAPDLGGQRCRYHEDRGDTTNYRKPAEHNSSLLIGELPRFSLGVHSRLLLNLIHGPEITWKKTYNW